MSVLNKLTSEQSFIRKHLLAEIEALIGLSLTGLFAAPAGASEKETESANSGEYFEKGREFQPEMSHVLDIDGEKQRYKIYRYKNAAGKLELKVTSADMSKLYREMIAPLQHPGLLDLQQHVEKLEPTLLIARDTDDDGLFDAWFFVTASGVRHTVLQVSTDPHGKDVLEDFARDRRFTDKGYLLARSLFTNPASFLVFTIANTEESAREYTQKQIDLLDREIRLDRTAVRAGYKGGKEAYQEARRNLRKNIISQQDLALEYFKIQEEWLENDNMLRKAIDPKTYLATGMIDMAVWGNVAKYAMKVPAAGWSKVTKTELVKYMRKQSLQVLVKSRSVTTKMATRLKDKALNILPAASKEAAAIAGRAKVLAQKGIETRALQAAQGTLTIVQQGIKHWEQTTAKQSASKVMADVTENFEALFDPQDSVEVPNGMDPNVYLKQKLAETVQSKVTGTTMALAQKSKGLVSQTVLCGMVSFADNQAKSMLVKSNGEQDNLQVLEGSLRGATFDRLKARFDDLSKKKSHPGYKLVGFAIAMVNKQANVLFGSGTSTAQEDPNFRIGVTPIEKMKERENRFLPASFQGGQSQVEIVPVYQKAG